MAATEPSPSAHGSQLRKLPAPPSNVVRWSKYLIGFTVTVAIGLAPLLGTVAVPGYAPLVAAFPADMRDLLTILLSLVFGFVAIGIQFFGNDRLSHKRLQALFAVFSAAFLITLFLLIKSLYLEVVTVEYDGGASVAAFVVGEGARPERCKAMCEESLSDAECIVDLSMNPARVDACWSDRRRREAELYLSIKYILVMSVLSVLVGLVLARERAHAARPA